MAIRTWLITGAGRGLGRAFVDGVLAHGDRVIATARMPEALASELEPHGDQALVLALDVNDSAAVDSAVGRALDQMGQLDVVVNNAGYGLSGGVEEVTEAQARAQFDTNFFGPLWVTQAVLPHMRAQVGPHHPDLEHRRAHDVAESRHLRGEQVGARSDERGACWRDRTARDQSDNRGTKRVSYRLGR
jgi:NAD(P)-dependent dehydrogenase (short-subunit alcohol dehydrogenase family)